MLSFTYPGDWFACCPTPSVAKRHLQAFGKRFERKWGVTCEAFWKLEFQSRGAPHFHVLTRLPDGVDLRVMRSWVARAWYEIVGSGDERHLRAGTAVDAKWRTWDNPAAIGFYFAKHGTWASKEYQHEVPEEWATTGRWWGAWNLPKIAETVSIDPAQLVAARRFLRRWFRSVHQPRLVAVREETHDGVVVMRESYRRARLRSLGGRTFGGAFVLTRDGPRFALALARALEGHSTVEVQGDGESVSGEEVGAAAGAHG
jgi:hypothetical protein